MLSFLSVFAVSLGALVAVHGLDIERANAPARQMFSPCIARRLAARMAMTGAPPAMQESRC